MPDFFGGSTIGNTLWVEVMVHDAAHEEVFGWITPQGGPQADREATMERMGRRVGLTPSGGCNDRGGLAGSGDFRLPPLDHSCAVY